MRGVWIDLTSHFQGRRKHLAVTYSRLDGWMLQWAHPTEHGHTFDPPVERGFRTKREATARKRELTA